MAKESNLAKATIKVATSKVVSTFTVGNADPSAEAEPKVLIVMRGNTIVRIYSEIQLNVRVLPLPEGNCPICGRELVFGKECESCYVDWAAVSGWLVLDNWREKGVR